MNSMDYSHFFKNVTGVQPYPYQRTLGEEAWPELLCIPTGLGKTAALAVAWLWKTLNANAETPRRLVYCLPMRVLVEQTASCVQWWVERAAEHFDRAGRPCPTVHVLMGGDVQDDWTLKPENPVILVGTQDMLLSRALMRGYAMSRYLWPVHFGLLHNDAFWIFDEVQLMGSGLPTAVQLEAFRRHLKTFLPCRSLWASATLQPTWLETVDFKDPEANCSLLRLSEEDTRQDSVRERLHAKKNLRRAATRLDKASQKKSWAAYAEALAQEVVGAHKEGTTTLVMVNTVERAQKIAEAVERLTERRNAPERPEVLLVHSRFRSAERQLLHEAVQRDLQAPGRIVVATQALEAGVDITSRILFTELAPWASLVQRFGRCNRGGEFENADVYWIDMDLEEPHLVVPYEAKDLHNAREKLERLSDVSPAGLPPVDDPGVIRAVIRKKDLMDLFNTDPDLSGFDVDVSLYIRDAEDADIQIFWRDVSSGWETQPLPRPEELCRASLAQAQELLRRWRKAQNRNAHDFGPFIWDSLDGKWRRFPGRLRPGMVLMVGAEAGGYSPKMGLWPEAQEAVPCLPPSAEESYEEIYESDPRSRSTVPVRLDIHLEDVSRAARDLCRAIGWNAPEAEAVERSAAWHDMGKAHPVFQASMHGCSVEEAKGRVPLLAKSEKVRRHARRHFRHELASALAFLDEADGTSQDNNLIAYLIAAHHGKVRMSLRAMPDEEEPRMGYGPRFARGVWEGEELPPVRLPGGACYPGGEIRLEIMELGEGAMGPSWTWRAEELLKTYGPFCLAWMEALVRIADWRASAEEEKERA